MGQLRYIINYRIRLRSRSFMNLGFSLKPLRIRRNGQMNCSLLIAHPTLHIVAQN